MVAQQEMLWWAWTKHLDFISSTVGNHWGVLSREMTLAEYTTFTSSCCQCHILHTMVLRMHPRSHWTENSLKKTTISQEWHQQANQVKQSFGNVICLVNKGRWWKEAWPTRHTDTCNRYWASCPTDCFLSSLHDGNMLLLLGSPSWPCGQFSQQRES